ncbi:MAG: hypothetical protein A2252_02440 [Elusimicrobia bacterium RIFOXYA2_FULL_39_19]|nr:MAG: hypothetical protein A2252_02440 [Elusimicrobia bacterium RIFOXYA2_FULL_39_19]
MKSKFNQIINRKNTNSAKWDRLSWAFGTENITPMSIADMDFKASGPILNAINSITRHGIFGYSYYPDTLKKAITQWFNKKHGVKLSEADMVFAPCVLASISFLLDIFTKPGDKVLIQTPVYPPFFNIVKENNRVLIENPLINRNGHYAMDFEDFSKKATGVKIFILCNPHNPVGRVWTKKELEQIGRICVKKRILIVSDDIHCDIIYKGSGYVPIAGIAESIAQNCVTLYSPNKTFGTAGLACACAVTKNEEIKKRFRAYIMAKKLESANRISTSAWEAGCNKSRDWHTQLIKHLENNMTYLESFIKDRLPLIKFVKPEGTFLAWLDCRQMNMTEKQLKDFFYKKAGAGLSPGSIFGVEGEGFMRMNIACPLTVLKKVLYSIERSFS